jgi:hypothetical protein
MPSFTQVFMTPLGTYRTVPGSFASLAEAEQDGKELAEFAPSTIGTFCYARQTQQMRLSLDTLYVLKHGGGRIRYRRENEVVFSPFDYLDFFNHDKVIFPLTWLDHVTGGIVTLNAQFPAARAFKFADLCNSHLVRFHVKGQKPYMSFCTLAGVPSGEVQLETVG